MPVIELHNFIFRGPRKTLNDLVANNGFNAGAVLAPGSLRIVAELWDHVKSMSIMVGDRVIGHGPPGRGGPVEGLDWLAKNLAAYGESLGPNDLVLTGTPLGLYPVGPGDTVRVLVDGRECVTCTVI